MTKPALRVRAGAHLAADAPFPWVSRGGVKLAAALDAFGIDPRDKVALDIGASTGGFTDVLVTRGAVHVCAVDVGRDQLHPRLRADPRVSDWAETDARALAADRFAVPPQLIVCDASFISLTALLPAVLPLAAAEADLVALIKPQFEVGRADVRKGLVRDAALRDAACARVAETLRTARWQVAGLMPSPIPGREGNIEFLVWARP